MDAGLKVGTWFPKVDEGDDRSLEEGTESASLEWGFPSYAQVGVDGGERKPDRLCGAWEKPRWMLVVRVWGFLQGERCARKCGGELRRRSAGWGCHKLSIPLTESERQRQNTGVLHCARDDGVKQTTARATANTGVSPLRRKARAFRRDDERLGGAGLCGRAAPGAGAPVCERGDGC